MADGERLEILLFKQPQQQAARFADSTCPATPGRASTTDESQRHLMAPSGPWTSLQRRQTSPLGQPDVPAGQPGQRTGLEPLTSIQQRQKSPQPLDELQLQTSRQCRQMWGLDSQGASAEEGRASPDEPALPACLHWPAAHSSPDEPASPACLQWPAAHSSPDEPAAPPDKTSWLGLLGTRAIWSRPAP